MKKRAAAEGVQGMLWRQALVALVFLLCLDVWGHLQLGLVFTSLTLFEFLGAVQQICTECQEPCQKLNPAVNETDNLCSRGINSLVGKDVK